MNQKKGGILRFTGLKACVIASVLLFGTMLMSSMTYAAGSCWLSGPSLNFGSVSSPGKTSSTNWQVTCNYYNHSKPVNVTLCPYATVGGLSLVGNRRQLVSYSAWPHSYLSYDLFYDPALTRRIDVQANLSTLQCVTRTIAVDEQTKVFNLPIYGLIYAGQNVAAGNFKNNNDISVTLLFGLNQDKVLTAEDVLALQPGNSSVNSLNITTDYENGCNLIAATDINFGQINDLSQDVNSASTVTLSCPLNTSWKVSLDQGLHYNGTTRRMRNGTGYIAYGLYQDANNTQTWTNTATAQGTGSNGIQSIHIYGKVKKSSVIPAAGEYQDTITVTLTY